MVTKLFSLLISLFSIVTFSQNSAANFEQVTAINSAGLITLQNLVEKIKVETAALRNVKTINVMVNDLLIEDLAAYMIDPKNISTKEILILEDNHATQEGFKASIIINTRKK